MHGPLTGREPAGRVERGSGGGDSQGTVKTHVGRILTKLGLRDRVQAVVLACETGLIRPGEGSVPPPGR